MVRPTAICRWGSFPNTDGLGQTPQLTQPHFHHTNLGHHQFISVGYGRTDLHRFIRRGTNLHFEDSLYKTIILACVQVALAFSVVYF